MGPSWADQTLTAKPQQRQRDTQQGGEQVSRPHGGKTTEKAERSFPQHPHGHTAHPLRWKPRQTAPRSPARPRDPQLPSEGTDLPARAHLYLSAAPVTNPPHPNVRDYKSRQPPRPPQTLGAGGAPRCTLGLVVLPPFPPELRQRGVRGALERAAAEAAVPGSGWQPTPFSARAVPVLPFSAPT